MKNIAFIIAMVLLVSCGGSNQNEPMEPSKDFTKIELSEVQKNTKVRIGKLSSKSVNRKIHCTGTIISPPSQILSIHSKVEGFAKIVDLNIGDYIKKGQLIIVVESPFLIEKQRHLLESKSDLELAEIELTRKLALRSSDATSQKSLEVAQANVNRLSATFNGLKKELSSLGIDVVSLEQRQNFQSEFKIISPSSGYVHNIFTNKGKMVQPQEVLAEIIDKTGSLLSLKVLQSDISHLGVGKEVKFTLPGDKAEYSATVSKTDPVLDTELGTLNTICRLNGNNLQNVSIGAFANAIIEGGVSESSGLPLSAVIKEGEIYYGYKVAGSLLEKTALKNPVEYDDFVTFENDLEGDWVIEGAYYIE